MILAIESSCDDSCVAIINSSSLELIAFDKSSQESAHTAYGGVVPEIASRLHTETLPAMVLKQKEHFKDLKAIAVTNAPGLSVSLISGVSVAKSLALALNLPLIGVNHLIGHIYSLFLDSEAKLPLMVLLVSGGHTMVLNISGDGDIEVLAQTSDDSFGESFDKAAKMLELGYPGGPEIERLAKSGDDRAFDFTIPLKGSARMEFSFSGLKNQVRLAAANSSDRAGIAASFERVAVAHIIDKLSKIIAAHKPKSLGIVGGASANLRLRASLNELCEKHSCELLTAPLKYCSDNAAMIARAAKEAYYKRAQTSVLDSILSLQISPRTPLSGMNIFNF